MTRVIGITGGIASGKSVVEALLAGYPVIDADRVAREVVAPGHEGLKAVVAAFGPDILLSDGGLDRRKLRGVIAHDKRAQATLNSILHPLIGKAIVEKIQALSDEPIVFVSAALMLETGSYKRYDDVIFISAPAAVRLERLLARDGMEAEIAKKLMAKQWPDEKKRPLATVEIVNDGDIPTLVERTKAALARLNIPWLDVPETPGID